MSDSCVDQFEDTVWDDLCLSEDIMELPDSRNSDDHLNPGSLKKRRRQKNNNSHSYEDEADEWSFLSLSKKRDIMSENDSWSRLQSELFPSGDGNGTAALSSVNSASSPHAFKIDDMEKGVNEFCANERIMNGTENTVDNDSFSYSLDDITDSIVFFKNTECKDSNDFSCYGWPEIGNFDDVFKMFRSCDSTFGVESSKEFEPGSLPKAYNTGESEELENIANNVLVSHESSKIDSMTLRGTPKDPSRNSEKSDSFMSFIDLPVMNTREQISEQGKEANNESFKNTKSLFNGVIRNPYESAFSPNFTSRYREKATVASPCNYLLQSSGSDKIQCSIDPVRSRDHEFNPRSPIDSSLTSIHSRTMQKSHVPPCENLSTKDDPVLIRKQICQGSSSKMNPELDDSSFEAKSFHQLQRAMDKLDTRTKLCIRDSLFRLSRSAERRHNYAKSNIHDNETSASFLPDEATSCFMSIERDTNPVDRSIAHLLFHRPSSSILDSPKMNHGSATSRSVRVENPEFRKTSDN